MGILEIILLAIGLSMDACAVSATNGMCCKPLTFKKALSMGLAFGFFQALMPLIGSVVGGLFMQQIEAVDHWIALILLCAIGGKMIYDGFKKDGSAQGKPFTLTLLLVQAVATSIDALAIGISLSAVKTDIIQAISIIGITTFLLSILFAYIGKAVGDKLNSKAEVFGGTILVLIGIKIFVEHMFF